ncbi:hypothetical protein GLAREA_01396 [Glarea lozoyensis ATCC 20868]|uniref:Uncharacterized protein n=1 Tax=Glarea lozoyensis (strain ATCC 20868 / MF5171) TaxID=1116229 RepID=S3CJS1_GLAL2|nr:uncharacterized protein GLAREA_01396 [Glarea lozoyensis ATCC 20868]EPE25484.1 hypothetical protein GLAREA_01396 [Glarea lozoyensis ATCC 20868]
MSSRLLSPFSLTTARPLARSLRFPPLSPTRIQIAEYVRVATTQRSKPNQPFAVLAEHWHPTAHKTSTKTYDVDVLLAEDDDGADVCWRFQIAEGEDELDRLLAYSQAFGKHGSGDEHYDEYVHAFQEYIMKLWVKKTCMDRGWYSSRGDDGGEIWSNVKPGEDEDDDEVGCEDVD